ncbi:MAG: sulfatase-like hydrolase/transferase [Phycisphaerae bacterium]|nr:sulfatase-like hydrolase/transferase [Phycisphaerae bacterium]
MASGSAAVLIADLSPGANPQSAIRDPKSARPNFLWISTEDINPDLGCYGDKYAVTPSIDRLAAQGVRYDNVFSHSGVCAPTRSGIITGMYPTTLGTHHMRCQGVPPDYVKCFPEYLRATGYYCTNNAKTDYQFDPPLTAWDECGNRAHWRNRPKDRPFFAVFNILTTHEGQIRDRSQAMSKRLDSLGSEERHDPAKAQLPPYYPDTPKVRQDWAQYYDLITLMDKQVQGLLDQLEADGLAEDTIVWFWGDNGRGLPRAKRWLYDSGTRVPLIVRVPKKWRELTMPSNPEAVKPGTVVDDLVAFIDFAPTMLSLAGIDIPKYIQGRAFLGRQKVQPREYVFGARDRMDEAYDLIRYVRDKRFKYIRNYMGHLSRGQDINYMNQMPAMQEMRRLNAEGKLQGPQKQYFEPTKPVEELYDIVADPHEINNLAGDPKHKDVLERMRRVHNEWYRDTMDVGLVPEPMFDEMKRPGGQYEKTAEPVFIRQTGNAKEGGTVTIACATQGASIAWRIGGNPKSATGWELYVAPVRVRPQEVLCAKACRIGFRDSDAVTFKLGDPIRDKPAATHTKHWRQEVEAAGLRQRLAKVKESDYQGPNAASTWLAYLKDPEPAVRYWAVMGLHASSDGPSLAQPAVAAMLQDPSVVVRIAAAHAVCDWGDEKAGLPVLVEALRHPTDKTRLFAVIALDKIGEKARPALTQIQALTMDRDEYVKRVATAVSERLRAKGEKKT